MEFDIPKFRVNYSDFLAKGSKDSKAIKSFQLLAGLPADGVIGPKTCFAFYSLRKTQLEVTHGLKLNKDRFRFSNTRARSSIANMAVFHDTISGTAERTFGDLKGAKNKFNKPAPLSTNYILDYDGTIYECNDVLTCSTVHAGALNEESVGVDIVNKLDPKFLRGDTSIYENAMSRMKKVAWSASSEFPGKAIDYTDAQKESLLSLSNFLAEWLRINRAVPLGLTGYGKKVDGFTELFNGFCAHGQWSTKRWDGLFAIEHLISNGYETRSLK